MRWSTGEIQNFAKIVNTVIYLAIKYHIFLDTPKNFNIQMFFITLHVHILYSSNHVELNTYYTSGGSGIALYINDPNEMYQFSNFTSASLCDKDIEWLFIEITNTDEPILVGVIYRPPSSDM